MAARTELARCGDFQQVPYLRHDTFCGDCDANTLGCLAESESVDWSCLEAVVCVGT